MSAYPLSGRVALVTGAARGIGLETARALHARGASVGLVDLDPAATRSAAERIAALPQLIERTGHLSIVSSI